MADAFATGQSTSTIAVHAHRPGLPFLVGALARWTGGSVDDTFLSLNLGFTLAAALLLYLLIARYVPWGYVVAVVTIYLLPWHEAPRMLFHYPLLIDPALHVLILLELLAIVTLRRPAARSLLLASITFVGMFFHQAVAVVPLSVLLAESPLGPLLLRVGGFLLDVRAAPGLATRSWRSTATLLSAVPMLAAGAAFLLADGLVPKAESYVYWREAARWVFDLQVVHVVDFVVIAFGPLIALLVVEWRVVCRHIRHQPVHGMVLPLVSLLAVIGGADKARYLYWSSPVVFLLIALAADEFVRQAQSRPAAYTCLGVMAVLQGVAYLVFLPIETEWAMGLYTSPAVGPTSSLGIVAATVIGLPTLVLLCRLVPRRPLMG
jgi:hypothetical protein